MMRAIVLAVLVCLAPRLALAEGRLNLRVDFTQASVAGVFNDVGIHWPGFEVEFEKAFKTHKVIASGLSFGVRREGFYGFTAFGERQGVQRWDEGTYLLLRVYRSFGVRSEKTLSISPSVAILYGIPGTTLDRTVARRREDGGLDYTHIFPMRNADLPQRLAQAADVSTRSAMLYPEVSLSVRKRFVRGGINLDWIAGMRILRFGVSDSGEQGSVFDERRALAPSAGMRMGFRIF